MKFENFEAYNHYINIFSMFILNSISFLLNKFNIMKGNVVIIKFSLLLLNWPFQKNGCSMDYHGNKYFLNIKKNECFATGRPDASYVIELKHMLHKIHAVSDKVHRFPTLCKRWGTLTPPNKI